MVTVKVERVVAAPIDEVFDWCATSSNYTRTPLVLRARLAEPGDGAPYGVGAVRLHTWAIGWFKERVTAYHPPHDFDYVVDRSFPPARHKLGRMTFTEVPGGTRVVWTSIVEVPFPIRPLARTLITYVFGKILDAADADLAER
ncbi:SRPBCC family protein [Actinocrispum wychmicini]|uniref:Polyketide cyclase/dehydrase/lipid transport protein n=1 Tax=Actinocrispum wychmicini TaxID=1213861 RepID=A0A4R2JL90_9PSEU|nr:SRPBCC family protein [Actinocrispum wychmicini]TCO60823.1 polyketide cyclase/dehydrase/lipid transport protein [Actinocrispum wychmicini]